MELINFSNIIRGRLQSISWAEYLLMVAVLELAIKLIYDLYKKAKVIKVLNWYIPFCFCSVGHNAIIEFIKRRGSFKIKL